MNDLIRKLSVLELIDDYNSDALGSVFINYSHGLKFKRAVLKLPSAQPELKKGKWIPCSERLPDTDDIMLVTCKPKKGSPNVNRAYYMDGAWHGSGSMSNVTAWMPLPKPYQEDKQ